MNVFYSGCSLIIISIINHGYRCHHRLCVQLFEEYMELMSSKSSYKSYRETLHTVNPPVIPYMGTYLTDITYVC